MGTVGEDHKCPLCGRKGHGGYHVDGMDCGPVCTVSTARSPSCLDKMDHAWPEQIMGQAIKAMFSRAPKLQLPDVALELVALYLIRLP